MVLRELRQEETPVSFKASVRDAGDVTVIEAAGPITLGAGGTVLRDLLHLHVSKGRKKFVLILREVVCIDSFGVGELVRCYATVRNHGGELVLSQVAPKVCDLLEITKLHTLFELHADEQAALRRFL